MWVLIRLSQAMRQHARRVTWLALLIALLLHMALVWVLLVAVGEEKLIPLEAYPYYYMTTATTIGYGDLSPQTPLGRVVVAFLMMPGAVALFAAVLTKSGTSLAAYWRRHTVGKMSYDDMKGHTILVGWRGKESERLVQLLLSDTATDDEGVVLVAEGLAENPQPGAIRYVATSSYADSPTYSRAAIAGAQRIIINPPTDDQTLAAVLAVMAHKPKAHVVAHFESASAMSLVCSHYPAVECTRPMSAEVIARAAQDPGSSSLTHDLLSAEVGATQFSLSVPPDASPVSFASLSERFRAHDAMLIGFRGPGQPSIAINPPLDTPVPPGAAVYYFAVQRVDPDALAWPRSAVPA